MHQKGFATLIFLLIIGVLSAGIVGGSLYIKNSHPELIGQKNNQPKTANHTEVLPTQAPIPTIPPHLAFQNKILFSTRKPGSTLQISDTKGENIQTFNTNLVPDKDTYISAVASPDSSKILIFAMKNITDPSNLRADQYIANVDGTNLKQLNTPKVIQATGYSNILFAGWSSNNQSLVFVASNDPNINSSTVTERAVGVMDATTLVPKILFKKNAPILGNLYYDQSENIVTYNQNIGHTDQKYYLFDLNKKTDIPLIDPNHKEVFSPSKENVISLSNQGDLDSSRTIKIYSLADLAKPKTQINLDNPPNFRFELVPGGVWSPTNKYLALFLKSQPVPNDERLNIYSQDGRLVSSTGLTDNSDTNRTAYLNDVPQTVIFSTNEEYLLYYSLSLVKPYGYNWEVIDVKSGNIIVKKFSTDKIGTPIAFF